MSCSGTDNSNSDAAHTTATLQQHLTLDLPHESCALHSPITSQQEGRKGQNDPIGQEDEGSDTPEYANGVCVSEISHEWEEFHHLKDEEGLKNHPDDLRCKTPSRRSYHLYVVVSQKWKCCKLGVSDSSDDYLLKHLRFQMPQIDYFFQVKICNEFKRTCLEKLAFWMFSDARQFSVGSYFELSTPTVPCMRDLYCMHLLWLSKASARIIKVFYDYFLSNPNSRSLWIEVYNLFHSLVVSCCFRVIPDVAWVYPMNQLVAMEFEGTAQFCF
jgi:hypothetical protein